MKRKARGTYQPDPAFIALRPPVSGNTVNGLGESERRPSPIFWHRPDREPHGAMQESLVARFNSVPAFHDVYARGDRGPRKPDPIAAERVTRKEEEWTAMVQDANKPLDKEELRSMLVTVSTEAEALRG